MDSSEQQPNYPEAKLYRKRADVVISLLQGGCNSSLETQSTPFCVF